MAFNIPLPKKETNLVIILVLIFLAFRLPFLNFVSFVQDENLYAMMAQDQLRNPSLVPTFLRYPVSWKPILFFWFSAPFFNLPFNLESSFRLSSFFFALLSIPILYYLLRNVEVSPRQSFFSIIMFIFSQISSYTNNAFLTDSMAFFFIISSLYVYTDNKYSNRRFLLAGFLAFLALFTKEIVPLVIPMLAVAYFYFKQECRTFRNPNFIISLSLPFLAFLIQFFLIQNIPKGDEFFIVNLTNHLWSSSELMQILYRFVGSIDTLISSTGIWMVLSFFGFKKFWKQKSFMSFWYVLSIIPFLGGQYMPWYYLPVLPAVCYFASLALLNWERKEKADAFFGIVFVLLVLVMSYFIVYQYFDLKDQFTPQYKAGMILTGKQNVLIIGGYKPALVSYKVLTEKRILDESYDFGWVLWINQSYDKQFVLDFLQNYNTTKYNVTQGSFDGIFTQPKIFRKDTNITKFDYIAIVGPYNLTLPHEVIYNKSDIMIYDLRK